MIDSNVDLFYYASLLQTSLLLFRFKGQIYAHSLYMSLFIGQVVKMLILLLFSINLTLLT